MKKIVIYGSGGFAKEVAQLIEDINENKPIWEVLGYIDDNIEMHGKIVNELPILGGREWFEEKSYISIALGIGSPKAKKSIVENLSLLSNSFAFPNIIHPTVKISKFNKMGIGNVICEGNVITTNISIKDFVTVNINSTIGHDTSIGSYSTILPNSSISGNVVFEEGVDFGTNATIIQGLTIGSNSIIGAGAVVVKDIPKNCTAVGMPAKPIKFHED
ncbi:acetyltransferase [Bhargavaea beijingensis]|uniref:acetyltransferase n=1 Tax=Bhargavaea beijingensis TaxID=426756 RepID=UPI002223FDFD|nr:acetyltransferase [Bhargavaea beijingensis]MCW1929100.1 acetyltransferase [Bhargavaea beijingensis]